MPYFYIYETVTFPIQLSDPEALKNCDKVVVTISQKDVQVNIDDPSIDEETGRLSIWLSQNDTAKFKKGTATIQVNIYYLDKERDVTTTAKIQVLDNLYKKVMP